MLGINSPWTYNLQVGSDKDQYGYGDLEWYDAFKGVPAVIHYTSHNKPWTSNVSIVLGIFGGFIMPILGRILLKAILKATLVTW